MRCIYDGVVTIPHSEYEDFRRCLSAIPMQRREAKFRGSIKDCWGARATIKKRKLSTHNYVVDIGVNVHIC